MAVSPLVNVKLYRLDNGGSIRKQPQGPLGKIYENYATRRISYREEKVRSLRE